MFAMALTANDRPGFDASRSFSIMALHALLVHHLFGLKRAFLFQIRDGVWRFRIEIMAQIAILKRLLMQPMWKFDIPLTAGRNRFFFCPLVDFGSKSRGCRYQPDGCDSQDNILSHGALPCQEPESVHCVKSISFPQDLQVCFLSNSSEKISISAEHEGHLQANDFRFLNCSNPGQCFGVVIIFPPG